VLHHGTQDPRIPLHPSMANSFRSDVGELPQVPLVLFQVSVIIAGVFSEWAEYDRRWRIRT
jgi:hypothetical protein